MDHKISHQPQAGFSLLELLIAMAISVIAITAGLAVMTKFTRTVSAYTEVSTLNEAAGTAESLLRADLDTAGHNLTRPSPSLAGMIFATPSSADFYAWSNGTITKTGDSSWDHPVNFDHALASGLGSYYLTPPARGGAKAEVTGPNGHSFSFVIDPLDNDTIGIGVIGIGREGQTAPISVYENGDLVASSSEKIRPGFGFRPHMAGDSYKIKIENDSSGRVMKLYRISRADGENPEVLWTAYRDSLPSYPVAFSLNIFNRDESCTNVQMTGAPLIPIANNDTELAPLPNDITASITAPITITGGGTGFFMLSGDRTTDAVTTIGTFNAGATQVDARPPQRGSFNKDDVVLIIDWGSTDPANPGQAASALCRVNTAVANSSKLALTFERIYKEAPAWGRLFSTETDHAHDFGVGSTIVKLQAPIAYNLSSDSRLVRIEGDRVSTVAFNVRRASFSRYVEFNSNAWMFLTDIGLAAEGVETNNTSSAETRNTIQFRSTPRALNLASNRQN
jgi:prepilin-type N-terminal cleavage/methylation domain-containing protein